MLKAAGGVSGTYTLTGKTEVSAFYRLFDRYDANAVYLEAVRVRSLSEPTQTAGQRAVAAGLESLPDKAPLRASIERLPNDTAVRTAYSALAGDAHSSLMGQLAAGASASRDAVLGRMRGDGKVRYLGDGGQTDLDTHDNPAIWMSGLESWGRGAGDGNAHGFRSALGGVTAGLDATIWVDTRLGLFAGYQRQTLDSKHSASGSSQAPFVGVYGGANWDRFSVRTGASYDWNDVRMSRFVAYPGFSDRLTSHYDVGTAQVFGEAGYQIDLDEVTGFQSSVEPLASLAGVRVSADGFMERGGISALYVKAREMAMGFTTLGMRGRATFDLGGIAVKATGTLGWRHALGDTVPMQVARFAGSTTFTTFGLPVDEDSLFGDVGLGTEVAEGMNLSVSYLGEIGQRTQRQGVRGTFDIAF